MADRKGFTCVRLCVHRGTSEIGGNCIEVESAGKSILLDLGMPLMGDISPENAMPPVRGLTDGTNLDLLAIVISHLQRLIEGIRPRRLVPIHTLAAGKYPNANSEILRLADGEWLTL